jgi:hypothetical protein
MPEKSAELPESHVCRRIYSDLKRVIKAGEDYFIS